MNHLQEAHQHWSKILRAGDLVVDATVGNGHDTAYLAELVGPSGAVLALDIQPEALRSAQQRVTDPQVSWHLSCHSKLKSLLDGRSPRLVVYNLGYLPGGDKSLTTLTTTSLESLRQAFEVSFAVSLLCYPGHPEGARELEAIRPLLDGLTGWEISHTPRPPGAPTLFFASRSSCHTPPAGRGSPAAL